MNQYVNGAGAKNLFENCLIDQPAKIRSSETRGSFNNVVVLYALRSKGNGL